MILTEISSLFSFGTTYFLAQKRLKIPGGGPRCLVFFGHNNGTYTLAHMHTHTHTTKLNVIYPTAAKAWPVCSCGRQQEYSSLPLTWSCGFGKIELNKLITHPLSLLSYLVFPVYHLRAQMRLLFPRLSASSLPLEFRV